MYLLFNSVGERLKKSLVFQNVCGLKATEILKLEQAQTKPKTK
jgi:hypothetical protein